MVFVKMLVFHGQTFNQCSQLVIAARQHIKPPCWRPCDDLLRDRLGQRDLQFSRLEMKIHINFLLPLINLAVGGRHRHPVSVPHNSRVRRVQVVVEHNLHVIRGEIFA